MPRQQAGQHAAGQDADRAAAGHHEAEDAHRLRAVRRLAEQAHDQGQRDRGDAGAGEPLDRAADDEERRVRGQAAHGGGDGEGDHAAEEDPLVAEQVAEPAGQQQEAAEGEQVGVDDPGQRGLREAEVGADRGQGDVHDALVEHDHQVAQAEHVEGQPAAASTPPARRPEPAGRASGWSSGFSSVLEGLHPFHERGGHIRQTRELSRFIARQRPLVRVDAHVVARARGGCGAALRGRGGRVRRRGPHRARSRGAATPCEPVPAGTRRADPDASIRRCRTLRPTLCAGPADPAEELRITTRGAGISIARARRLDQNRREDKADLDLRPSRRSTSQNTYLLRVEPEDRAAAWLRSVGQDAPGSHALQSGCRRNGNLQDLQIIAETDISFQASYIDQAGFRRLTIERWVARRERHGLRRSRGHRAPDRPGRPGRPAGAQRRARRVPRRSATEPTETP